MISLALVLQYSSEKRLNRLIVYIYHFSFQHVDDEYWFGAVYPEEFRRF